MQQLEERRARIEEGEAMHARSEKELAEVKAHGACGVVVNACRKYVHDKENRKQGT